VWLDQPFRNSSQQLRQLGDIRRHPALAAESAGYLHRQPSRLEQLARMYGSSPARPTQKKKAVHKKEKDRHKAGPPKVTPLEAHPLVATGGGGGALPLP
jgi:hypothetical protein